MHLSVLPLLKVALILTTHAAAAIDEQASEPRTDLYPGRAHIQIGNRRPSLPLPPSPASNLVDTAYAPYRAGRLRSLEIIETAATREQRYQAFLRLGHRLIDFGSLGTSMQAVLPPHNAEYSHLVDLSTYLQITQDSREAVFLDVTQDRRGRLVAVLYPRLQSLSPGRVTWAILQIHPARAPQVPRIEWYAYVSHRELNIFAFDDALAASSDVKSLRHFLTRPI